MIKNTQNIIPKIRLGVDLDGVVYDFPTEFQNLVASQRGVEPETLAPPTKWSFYEDWGMTQEEYLMTIGKAAVNGHVFANGDIYPDAVENIQKLKDLGYEIVIITAREVVDDAEKMDLIRENTENWLKTHNVPYDELIINNDKTLHNLDILVDDSLSNIEHFVSKGGAAYVFNRPWNTHNTFYARVEDWEDCVLEMKSIQDRVKLAFSERSQSNVQSSDN